ncbi:MAG: tRNA guanosine(34) transglycosylase Tgt [Opitutales bacterium]
MSTDFQIQTRDSKTAARTGSLSTPHGLVETPVFMPVGTQGTVKATTPAQLKEIGTQILLGNTYHLHLRPGEELIHELGGLHRFMGWQGPILTDSGGFQVFSLAKMRKVTEEGIEFQSHLSGEPVFLGPKEAMDIQAKLGSDIAMVLDECPPYPSSREACREAVGRTVRWAEQALARASETGFFLEQRHLFGIVQGSSYPDLRRECAEKLAALPFSGYAVGGVSVGEPEEEMLLQVGASVPYMPEDKPRYAMGLGTPSQILKMIGLGVDMFVCVMPTRLARHGTAFTYEGVVNLRNQRFRNDERPIVESMDNYTCRHFSRAYLRHLLMAGETLASTLLSLHNLYFFLHLVRQAREHIEAGDFEAWSRQWIARYETLH